MNQPIKILIVDDDPYILMSLEFLMKKSGYAVSVARNGKEALKLVDDIVPDVVILDIMMPDVDGYAICSYIKSTPHLQHGKVIFLTARSKEADIRKGYELGAEMYITKPFSTKELMKQVQTLVTG